MAEQAGYKYLKPKAGSNYRQLFVNGRIRTRSGSVTDKVRECQAPGNLGIGDVRFPLSFRISL